MAKLRSASWQWGGQKNAIKSSLLLKTGTDGSQCCTILKASIFFILMGFQKWLLHDSNVTCEEPLKQLVCPLPIYQSNLPIDPFSAVQAVRAIGRCAVTLERAAERCINVLLDLIKQKVNYVVQEAVVVITDIFRRYPNRCCLPGVLQIDSQQELCLSFGVLLPCLQAWHHNRQCDACTGAVCLPDTRIARSSPYTELALLCCLGGVACMGAKVACAELAGTRQSSPRCATAWIA